MNQKKQTNSYHVTVKGRFASLNQYIDAFRLHRIGANRMKRDAQNLIIADVLNQLGRLKIHNPIEINYVYYEPNKKRDLDNISGFFHKVFQDALVKAGVIHNDSWHYIIGYSDKFYVDSRNPRIEVEIKEVKK